MKHARKDYARLQDPEGKIPMDEPVFFLRGQDIAAPDTVRHWAREANALGARSDIVSAAYEQANEMERWQHDYGSKVPDMPENK